MGGCEGSFCRLFGNFAAPDFIFLEKILTIKLKFSRFYATISVLRPHLGTTFRTRTYTLSYFAHLEVILRTRTYFT
jgi:hypothetical protein